MFLYEHLGVLYQDGGALDSALYFYRKGQAINKNNTHQPDVHTSFFLSNIGLIYKDQGSFDLAFNYLQQAIKIDRKLFGENHINVATNYFNLGDIYDQAGAYDIAESYYSKALRIQKKVLGTKHLETADSYYALAAVNCEKKEHARALHYTQQAEGIYQQFSNYPSYRADNYSVAGLAWCGLKNYQKAEHYCRRAIQLAHLTNYRQAHLSYYYEGMGDLYYMQQRYAKARRYYQRALSQPDNDTKEASEFHTSIARALPAAALLRLCPLPLSASSSGEYDGGGRYDGPCYCFVGYVSRHSPGYWQHCTKRRWPTKVAINIITNSVISTQRSGTISTATG